MDLARLLNDLNGRLKIVDKFNNCLGITIVSSGSFGGDNSADCNRFSNSDQRVDSQRAQSEIIIEPIIAEATDFVRLATLPKRARLVGASDNDDDDNDNCNVRQRKKTKRRQIDNSLIKSSVADIVIDSQQQKSYNVLFHDRYGALTNRENSTALLTMPCVLNSTPDTPSSQPPLPTPPPETNIESNNTNVDTLTESDTESIVNDNFVEQVQTVVDTIINKPLPTHASTNLSEQTINDLLNDYYSPDVSTTSKSSDTLPTTITPIDIQSTTDNYPSQSNFHNIFRDALVQQNRKSLMQNRTFKGALTLGGSKIRNDDDDNSNDDDYFEDILTYEYE